ncbi:hypothetical protein LWI29_010068 [Acer saccharum]|uniref:Reverse transcriptase zinc-binding domain-containing protein n=1 Tax=Acer saccharum TaxID=4024 RepID=A0AA39TD93_ACESA|nr:hypothetical protein LWI29_010068 [Acer saccharum]
MGDTEDCRIWRYDKCGVFTVKSRYWVGRNLCAEQCQSSSNDMKDWWKKMWKIEIPLKIKIFIWKACFDWIPTRGNLGRRGINCDETYQICGKSRESTLHALWECSKLKYARVWWLPSGKFYKTYFNSVFDLLGFYSKLLTKGEIELFCIIIWKVWCTRNDWMHNRKQFDMNEVV